MKSPIKPSVKSEILPVLLLVSISILSFYFYSIFPERVPTHWNFEGEVNGYSSKAVGAFLVPGLAWLFYLLLLFLPGFDPNKDRYRQFEKTYHIIKGSIIALLGIIYLIASAAAINSEVKINFWLPLVIGILFVIIGNYMPKLQPNWFMGIRTPWTLSNELIWKKTHQLGGKLFILAGLMMAIIPFFADTNTTMFLFTTVIAISLIPVFYSLYLFKKLK